MTGSPELAPVFGRPPGGGEPFADVTTMVPDMPMPPAAPWILQWYGKVPTEENVWENVCPLCRQDDSCVGQLGDESNAPASDVTVCGLLPPSLHVTDSPTLIVITFGPNELSTMDTDAASAGPATTTTKMPAATSAESVRRCLTVSSPSPAVRTGLPTRV